MTLASQEVRLVCYIIGTCSCNATESKNDVQQSKPMIISPTTGAVSLAEGALIDHRSEGLEIEEICIEHLHL